MSALYSDNAKLAKAAVAVESAWVVACDLHMKVDFDVSTKEKCLANAQMQAMYTVVERFVGCLRNGKQRRENFEKMVDSDEFNIIELLAMSAKLND